MIVVRDLTILIDQPDTVHSGVPNIRQRLEGLPKVVERDCRWESVSQSSQATLGESPSYLLVALKIVPLNKRLEPPNSERLKLGPHHR